MPPSSLGGWPRCRVNGWAESNRTQTVPGDQLTKEQVRTLVLASATSPRCSLSADPKLKAEVYTELGVERGLRPDGDLVSVSAVQPRVCNRTCRRGDLNPYALAGTSPSS